MSNCAVIFFAWGSEYLDKVQRCIEKSPELHKYDKILITSEEDISPPTIEKVVRGGFSSGGLKRKASLHKYVPQDYDSYLFLDADTLILDDISYGFEKAEQHGLALALAPAYSLQAFNHQAATMRKEGIEPRGQNNYNTGVIFFTLTEEVVALFEEWEFLVKKYRELPGDQFFFSIAMEKMGMNPFVLNQSFNFRAWKGQATSDRIRIWHNKKVDPVANINKAKKNPGYRVIDEKQKVPKR